MREYGAHTKLIGKNYPTADLYAKVTGNAKFAEDFRAEGMLFTKLLLSPLPHARVKHIDASEALAMPGVRGIHIICGGCEALAAEVIHQAGLNKQVAQTFSDHTN